VLSPTSGATGEVRQVSNREPIRIFKAFRPYRRDH
jgi:hypothetical protein